jgi:hypothetical protein
VWCHLNELQRKRASDTRTESSDKAKVKIQSLLTNFMKSERTAKWCLYEWFCADMDRPFFEYNDFQHCLNEMGLGHITHLTRYIAFPLNQQHVTRLHCLIANRDV